MKILVGSYNKNIYEVSIENEKFKETKIFKNIEKPSYLISDLNLSYIYSIDKIQYAHIENNDVLLNEGACHISYDKVNNLAYISFYGAGLLKVLAKKDKWQVSETFKYTSNSKIHYAEYIDTINLVGVVDLGENNLMLYEVIDGKLTLKTSYIFQENVGPRHFTFHKTLPIIYLISELIPKIFVFKYENGSLILLEEHFLIDGYGSAIRLTKDNKFLYGAVRKSNYLFSFNVHENGFISLTQKISTEGDHPRDFNLIDCDKYLVVANMHSNDLSLFKIVNGTLYLKDSKYNLDGGASIIHK